jgi:small-conductance mechanosensitive channel
MRKSRLIRQNFTTLAVPAVTFSIATLIALLVRHVLLRWVDRHVTNKQTFAHVFLDAVRMPSVLWCIAIGLHIAIRNSDPGATVEYWAAKSIGAFAILSIGLVAAAIAVRMIAIQGESRKLPFAVAGLSHTLVYVFVFSIAGLMLLRLFDVTITPLLTALGVGGLAVALALQDTLGNFFAGVHILVEEPITVGDFIRLSTGEEGVVRDIGWRTTRIHTAANNIIVIPNTKITSGILTNHSLPEPRVTAEVVIVAAHEADPERIVSLAMDAAAETEGVLDEPSPSVMFDPGVLPTHIQMKLIVHVANVLERGRVQSEIRARLFQGFRREGIPLPVVRPA